MTFRIDEPGGRRVALRLHRPGYHHAPEIASEVLWIEALRREGIVSTPQPIHPVEGAVPLRIGEGEAARFVTAFAFVEGHEPAMGANLPDLFEELGFIAAAMHEHARRWVRPPGFSRKTWDPASMFGPAALWGPWRAGIGLDAPGIALLERALDLIARRLERFGRAADRFGLIHADPRLANLLVDGDTVHVIDFDDCGFGWFGYDFATAVSFFEDDPRVPALQARWLEGYRRRAPFSAEAEAVLPCLILARRILLVAWVASHPQASSAQGLGVDFTRGALGMAEQLLTREG
jgi:Ser/Thr protein kinase RdoA (MazF antagonist)